MKKESKYYLMSVIQGNCGYGWDDYSAYDPEDRAELKRDLKDYRENEDKVMFRVIRIRWKRGVMWSPEQRWDFKRDCIK